MGCGCSKGNKVKTARAGVVCPLCKAGRLIPFIPIMGKQKLRCNNCGREFASI